MKVHERKAPLKLSDIKPGSLFTMRNQQVPFMRAVNHMNQGCLSRPEEGNVAVVNLETGHVFQEPGSTGVVKLERIVEPEYQVI